MNAMLKAAPPAAHPIEDPELHRKVASWTQLLLDHSRGSGQVTVTFDFKDWRLQGVRFGGEMKERA